MWAVSAACRARCSKVNRGLHDGGLNLTVLLLLLPQAGGGSSVHVCMSGMLHVGVVPCAYVGYRMDVGTVGCWLD